VAPSAFVIAADGGADWALAMGLVPAIVIGDMDSISEEAMLRLRKTGAEFHAHSRDKDQTDLELAMDMALRRDPEDILIVNAMGGRWDMTLANVLLLSAERFHSAGIRIVDGSQCIRIIGSNQQVVIAGRIGDTLSLIPLDRRVRGVRVTGAAWPLDGEALDRGSTRGVSNRFTSTEVAVSVKSGLLACVHIRSEAS
jgi:thiamine pyrophosphokinase